MKKIQYSVSLMKNPIKGTTKAYGNLQLTGVVTINELAEHMAEHNTVFSKGTIVGVLSDLSACLRELILQGYKIQLADIGSFEPTISTKGEPKVEDFTAADITGMKVLFPSVRTSTTSSATPSSKRPAPARHRPRPRPTRSANRLPSSPPWQRLSPKSRKRSAAREVESRALSVERPSA